MRKKFMSIALVLFSYSAIAQNLKIGEGDFTRTDISYYDSEEGNKSLPQSIEIIDTGGGSVQVIWGRYSTRGLSYEGSKWGYTRDLSEYSISVSGDQENIEVYIMVKAEGYSNASEVLLKAEFRKR